MDTFSPGGHRAVSGPGRWRAAAWCVALILAAGGGVHAAAPSSQIGSDPLPAGVRPAYLDQRERVSMDEIVVRFDPAARVRVRNGRPTSLTGRDVSGADLAIVSFDGTWEPRFRLGEETLDALRARGEEKAQRALPDLNAFATVRLPHESDDLAARARLDELLRRLGELPVVAEAWAQPLLERAAVVPGSDAATADESRGTTTPDYSSLQGYLYGAPVGVEAPTAWTYPGGLGQGVDMIDIEWGWLYTHEDLKAPFHVEGDAGQDDHGTAVLGEIAGQHNGYGVDGISPEVRIGSISLNTFGVAEAITAAANVLDPGDVFLMEVQCGGSFGLLPCEWWSDVFAAIQVATAAGVICVEAGGNGSNDLDNPELGGLFDKRVRNSGAIMVGAGTPSGLDAESFSNYGSRVDLQGWGSSIVTTCCGDLQNGDPTVRYTAGFNGTSGASPIVVGSVCSLQGQAMSLFGTPLTPDLAEEILGSTGSPWNGSRQIGERPDLAAARARLELGYGNLALLVRDADTQEPMAGMVVQLVETGRLLLTAADGTIATQLSATGYTIRVEGDFYHPELDVPFVMPEGGDEQLIIDLPRAPVGSLAGQVRTTNGSAIADAQIVLRDTPIPVVQSEIDGAYQVSDIPEGAGYSGLAYGVPGYGVAQAVLEVLGATQTDWNPVLVDAQTFETSDGGYAPTNEWQWGVPGNPVPPFSGSKVWGTNLGGFYGDNVFSVLTSPTFDLSDATEAYLSFHHWYWANPEDGGQLQVWEQPPGRWIAVDPIGGYPDPSIQVLGDSGGYNGYTVDGYVPAIFDLSAFAGGDLRFRFYFRSDASGHKLGWYIDDVALDTGQGSTVSVDDLLIPSGDRLRLVSAGPNPASAENVLRFALSAASEVTLTVVDATGHRVCDERQRFPEGVHEMRWDGVDGNDVAVPAGVYYFRLSVAGDDLTGRWVRVR
ncbi:MAG: S8 family serine peptidase [Candidatus Eisenbacteria bacterium]|uniref:S8 family serine peptidase n=1 Tax=Eiseniibacteriota bacterium TaxID=2212470 RepID=A0A956LX89_UNCEI|nr:S8 family serine peptidase [Candidatus Eisenbacteria bacterium]